jgi:protein-S-isoprenylcysteine O-methyltransferase Ste14
MSKIPSLGPRGEGWVALQLVLLAAVVGSGLVLPPFLEGAPRLAAAVSGLALLAAGLGLVALSGGRLGASLTPLPRPSLRTRLVQSGPYGLVRHPIYAGVITSALGWALLTASLAAMLLVGLLAIVLDLKARREEAWLVEHDPSYEEYMRRTRRFIPLVY